MIERRTFRFQPALTALDYIRLARGVNEVGDIERTYLFHLDGTFDRPTEKVRAGDVIIVPTRKPPSVIEAMTEGEAERLRVEQEAMMQRFESAHQVLPRFGMDYFEPMRERIRNIQRRYEAIFVQDAQTQQDDRARQQTNDGTQKTDEDGQNQPTNQRRQRRPLTPGEMAEIEDAITGFVTPADQMEASVMMSRQTLASGDTIQLTWWSLSSGEPPQTVALKVAPEGDLTIPGYGRLTVRGWSLEQLEQNAAQLLARETFTDVQVVATFDRLRSIQVSIIGNAFHPGTYRLSSAVTLFNALYFCGGPNDAGSLRNITVHRGDEVYHVDFYRYLLYGDADQDRALQGGDMIFFGSSGRQASASGEVQRPGVYELGDEEQFDQLLEMAGGIRPSGFAKSIQIDSVRDNAESVVINVDATGDTAPPKILDGDRVTVYSVLTQATNTVQVRGYVRQPRVYELKEGMRVADAIRAAGGLRDEAYRERADLFRLNPDGETRTLIPIHLADALSDDREANIPLQRHDRVFVYSRSEVDWHPPREVSAQGAVVKPGNYPRLDGMRVSDLIRLMGGVKPEGHKQRALLQRVDSHNRLAINRSVNLDTMEAGSDDDLMLMDGDVLLVLRHEEAVWEPEQLVRVTGAVQFPGDVAFLQNMRVTDAIARAGGAAPDYASAALLLRKGERADYFGLSRVVNLEAALRGDLDADLVLQPEDEIVVYHRPEVAWEPEHVVTVFGAVQEGDQYPRTDGMRVSDLLFRAGGILPNAYIDRADLIRFLDDHETQRTVAVDLRQVLAGVEAADIPLQDGDILRISTIREATYVPEDIVTIYGAVQHPDTYIWTDGMTLEDVLFLAGDVLPGHRSLVEIARARTNESTTIDEEDISDRSDDAPWRRTLIQPGDVISVTRSI
ncbi:MAG: SLBB domain-containing protein, partial [Candidatus Poribacteria bacterium]|nr:SLBB domain-containing protein [Candidatus Poribacteria bacterium]